MTKNSMPKGKIWDDKFGLIDICKPNQKSIKIKGVGKDAEIITNKKGAKQSDVPMALHLIDPFFVITLLENKITNTPLEEAVLNIYACLQYNNTNYIRKALHCLTKDFWEMLYIIGCVLKEGETKYPPNNWRNISREEHLNHALNHVYASIVGDTQDNHIEHAVCRLMMAYATEISESFNYTKYIKKAS